MNFFPQINHIVYVLGMVFFRLSTTLGSINFIVTAFRNRAPGMPINRMPFFIWGTLTASAGNLLAAVPAVSLAFFMLWLDHQFNTHFFDPAGGGHPWVYAIQGNRAIWRLTGWTDTVPAFEHEPTPT